MSAQVLYSKDARRDLTKLDTVIAQRILKKIHFWGRQKNPLYFAKPLAGLQKGLYRFRVGDYRIIFQVTKDGNLIIFFILAVKHRREVYRV